MSKIILTVDDSRTMRDMLNLALVDAGFRVIQAEDGMHGLEVLRANEAPDVIVTDINMPARRLRLHRGGAQGSDAIARSRSWC